MNERNLKRIDALPKEFEINPKSIALVTATYYPDYKGTIDIDNISSLSPEQIAHTATIRGNLALKTAKEAVRSGYSLFISEGGSNELFLKDLNEIAGVTVMKRPSPGRAVGRRQGYEEAALNPEIEATIWLEPEKHTLVKYVPFVAKPLLNNEADIVIIGRDQEVFKATWPPYMWETEVRANKKWNNYMHEFDLLPEDVSFDMWAGPKAFRNTAEIVKLWTEKYEFEKGSNPPTSENQTGWYSLRKYAKPEQFSDGQYFPVVNALNKRRLDPINGPRVMQVTVPFEYPAIQRANEMTPEKEEEFLKKRKDQFFGFLVEGTQFIRYLSDPNSPKSHLHKL